MTRIDPGPDGVLGNADDGGMLMAYSLANPGNAFFLFTNPEGAMRKYDGVQVIGRKRDSRGWQIQASYTWSRTEGSVSNLYHNNIGVQDLGNPGNYVNPNRLINAYGRNLFDPTHEAKVLGTTRFRALGGLNVSGVYRYATENAWGRQVVVRGLAQGQARIRVEPSGARRLPATSVLDLRVEQAVRSGPKKTRLGVFVDVFNVTNRGIAESVNGLSGPTFGQPTAWSDPRTVRIGVRYWF